MWILSLVICTLITYASAVEGGVEQEHKAYLRSFAQLGEDPAGMGYCEFCMKFIHQVQYGGIPTCTFSPRTSTFVIVSAVLYLGFMIFPFDDCLLSSLFNIMLCSFIVSAGCRFIQCPIKTNRTSH
jgi:hypothetical protein